MSLCICFAQQDADTRGRKRRDAFILLRDREDGWHFARGADDPAVQRSARAAVANDAQRVAAAFHAAGEQGIVREHCAHAYHDASQAVARLMDVRPGGFAGHPAAVAGAGGGLAVQRHRVLKHHIGRFVRDVVEEHLVEPPALVLAHAGLDRDARVA